MGPYRLESAGLVGRAGPEKIVGPNFESPPIADNFQASYWCNALNQAYKEGTKYKPPKDWDDL